MSDKEEGGVVDLEKEVEEEVRPTHRRKSSLIILNKQFAKCFYKDTEKIQQIESNMMEENKGVAIIDDTTSNIIKLRGNEGEATNLAKEEINFEDVYYEVIKEEPTDIAITQAAALVHDADTSRFELNKIDYRSIKAYFIYHHRYIKYVIRFLLIVEAFVLPIFETPQLIHCNVLIPSFVGLGIILILFFYSLLQFTFLTNRSLYIPYKGTKKEEVEKKLGGYNPEYDEYEEDEDEDDEESLKILSISSINGVPPPQITQKNPLQKLMDYLFIFAQFLILVDVSTYLAAYFAWGVQFVRWSRVFRAYLVLYYFRSLRIAFYNILRMVPKILEILFIIFILLLIYSLVSFFLFLETPEGDMYMPNLLLSFISYYTLMTTVNFPDVMMPTYSATPWTSLIFISFLIFVFYFLLNLVLALIVKIYSQLMREQIRQLYLFERQRLYYAFVLLDPSSSGGISFKTWHRFISELRPNYSYGKATFLFRLINTSNSGVISIDEFGLLLNYLQMQIRTAKKEKNFLERHMKFLYRSQFSLISTVGRSRIFEGFMLLVVLGNVSMIIYTFLHSHSCDMSASFPELIFITIFFIEFLIRVITYGPGQYFSSGWFLLDFFLLLIAIVDIILSLTIHGGCRNLLLKVLYFSPTLRLFRFLTLSSYFNNIASTITLIFPSLLIYCAMQILMYYLWVILGMELWGGEIYQGNPLLQGTGFALSNYYANNFNNFIYAYVTCFELMVVNNWHVIASGYIAISGPYAWLFFLSFNLWVVIIVVGWVVACIIESFQVHYERQITKSQNDIQQYVADLNDKWRRIKIDVVWEAQHKKRFRAALEQIYGSKDAEEFVHDTIGSPAQAVASAREHITIIF